MRPRLRSALRLLTPPGVVLGVRAARARLRGDAPDTDDPVLHNTLVSFAYVLALAARGRSRMTMLDWGGGLGHYSVVAKGVLPDTEIDYTCKEVAEVVRVGAEFVPAVRFVDDEEASLAGRYDLVLASGSLHYSQNWRRTLVGLAGATRDYLYVTRLPVALASCAQRWPAGRCDCCTTRSRPSPGNRQRPSGSTPTTHTSASCRDFFAPRTSGCGSTSLCLRPWLRSGARGASHAEPRIPPPLFAAAFRRRFIGSPRVSADRSSRRDAGSFPGNASSRGLM